MNPFRQFMQRWKLPRDERMRKILAGTVVVFGVLLLLMMVFRYQSDPDPDPENFNFEPGTFAPRKSLDYDLIELDTLEIPNFPRNEPLSPPPVAVEAPPPSPPQRVPPVPQTAPQRRPATPVPSRPAPVRINKNRDMIITNNLAENPVGSATPGVFTGRASALVKVVLPARTEVSNGSLVEARVLHDFRWGNTDIPRRSKMIGVAQLLNRRVQIDFREIVIDGKSRPMSGRAYDLKRLQGLAYSPVDSETKRVVEEELRDAVTGVPVLGRMATRRSLSTPLGQDTAELEEGLEFYVFITSIY